MNAVLKECQGGRINKRKTEPMKRVAKDGPFIMNDRNRRKKNEGPDDAGWWIWITKARPDVDGGERSVELSEGSVETLPRGTLCAAVDGRR